MVAYYLGALDVMCAYQAMTLCFCSEQAAKDTILYSYRHGFSGFAAVLTDRQAARLSGEFTHFGDLAFCSGLCILLLFLTN